MFLNEETKISRHHQLPSAWYSYDKYLKAYGCEFQKGRFPYEYMDGIGKLRIVLYLLKKRSTVDSRTKVYPTKTTLDVRQCGVTTG